MLAEVHEVLQRYFEEAVEALEGPGDTPVYVPPDVLAKEKQQELLEYVRNRIADSAQQLKDGVRRESQAASAEVNLLAGMSRDVRSSRSGRLAVCQAYARYMRKAVETEGAAGFLQENIGKVAL